MAPFHPDDNHPESVLSRTFPHGLSFSVSVPCFPLALLPLLPCKSGLLHFVRKVPTVSDTQRETFKTRSCGQTAVFCFHFPSNMNVFLCCVHLWTSDALSTLQKPAGTSSLFFIFNISLLPTCACSSPLSLSSAVSPLVPRGGAVARLPEIPDVGGTRRTGGLPERAWKDRTAAFVPRQPPAPHLFCFGRTGSCARTEFRSRVTTVRMFIHAAAQKYTLVNVITEQRTHVWARGPPHLELVGVLCALPGDVELPFLDVRKGKEGKSDRMNLPRPVQDTEVANWGPNWK